jgi:hypothetical protein
MHQPGYVQGGQEVGRDYLLLRIHVRRIPSDIISGFYFSLRDLYLEMPECETIKKKKLSMFFVQFTLYKSNLSQVGKGGNTVIQHHTNICEIDVGYNFTLFLEVFKVTRTVHWAGDFIPYYVHSDTLFLFNKIWWKYF